MKIVLHILIFLLSISWLCGQTIFDIEIDEIYLDNDEIAFVNKGEVNSFLCKLTPIVVKDYKYNIILECEEDNDWMWSENPVKIQFDQLIKFDKPHDLTNYIKKYKYAKSSNKTNLKHNAFLQYFNEHLFANLHFNNFDPQNINWQFYKADFWDFVFIRINGKYLIIALVFEDDPRPGGFIIPMKDQILVVSKLFTYQKDGGRIDSLNLAKQLPLANFYRVKNNASGQEIIDKLFQEKIIDKNFKNVKFKENYIQCYSDNKMELYDKSGKKIDIKDLKAAYDSLGSIQCIIKDEIKWLDFEWNIYDTFPKPKWSLCGTISSTERKIEKINNKIYEFYTSGYWGEKENRDSILILDDKSVNEITYLNNQISDAFDDYSDLLAVFSFPYQYYVLTGKNEKHLIAITNKRKEKERELIIERDYRNKNQTEKDSINTMINKLEDDIVIEVLFTGNFEAFGYYHPIKFESGGLFGYYPQNGFAKYRRIEKFNFFFAEFEDKDGRIGWLDIYGKEYYKKK
ncbi:MAG: hypothetical protein IPF52_15085 [Saprospiraceae bacterium]|nr:hypothetical protein [Saprospiraceae bacterium]